MNTKVYTSPIANVVTFSTEENILQAGSPSPASINDSYTSADALSNKRNSIWDEE